MFPKQSFHRPTLLIALAFLTLLGLCWKDWDFSRLEADAPKPQPVPAVSLPKVTVYDADPQHLWNRLYAALYVRTSADGQTYGEDGLDPLLWPSSKYLLTKPRHQQAVTLLEEFLSKNGENLIQDPLKRALFQRDLWAIFDWLADPDAEYQGETGRLIAERRRLQVRLAQVMRRLALPADRIQALTDNYAAAVAAKTFPTRHDPSHPDKAFLPANLMEANGPWVLLTERGGPVTAPQHVHFTRGRSSFFVLMNLAGGRKATLDYLEKLRSFPSPLMPRPADRSGRFHGKFGPLLNPELPQFPVGTQVALAREMMVLDEGGKITPIPLIESLQFRVYRDIPKVDPSKQDFYEFRLRRRDLFAGKSGGLHAVGPMEREFQLFSAHDLESFFGPFEKVSDLSEHSYPIMNSCNACHKSGPGIHSVLSYNRGFSLPPDLVDSNRKQQEFATRFWKQRHYSWGFLQGLLESQPRK